MSEIQNPLKDQTVILDLVFRRPTIVRPSRTGTFDTDADRRWISVHKQIVKSDHYKEACVIAGNFIQWLRLREVPSPFKRGMHLIPLTLVDEVYAKLDDVEQKYIAKAEEFLAEYEDCKAEAKERLQSMYNEANYPSVDYLRRGFGVERRLIDFSVPGQGKVGSAIEVLERTKAQQRWQEITEEVAYAMREQLRELIAHLADRLEPGVDGKKKALHESAITKVLDWMGTFKNRNILEDSEAEELVRSAKAVLMGNPVSVIRDNASLRASLQSEMNKVKMKLDTLLVNAPARRISFEEDE